MCRCRVFHSSNDRGGKIDGPSGCDLHGKRAFYIVKYFYDVVYQRKLQRVKPGTTLSSFCTPDTWLTPYSALVSRHLCLSYFHIVICFHRLDSSFFFTLLLYTKWYPDKTFFISVSIFASTYFSDSRSIRSGRRPAMSLHHFARASYQWQQKQRHQYPSSYTKNIIIIRRALFN